MNTDKENRSIYHFLRGYLVVEIRGNALERFVSQIIASDISLWDVKRIEKNYYVAKVLASDYNKLRPLVRKRLCHIKIIGKKGLPFVIKKAINRNFLLIGFLLFLAIFYLGSSFMWTVKIDGLKNIPEQDIKYYLKDYGLRPGLLKKNVNLENIEKGIMKRDSRLAWLNLKWRGTQLYIEIVEKKTVNKEKPTRFVAASDGQITKLIVLKGQAVVKEGDMVTRGQPLIISGEGDESVEGIVKANVWYTAAGNSQLFLKEMKYTGETRTYWGIRIGTSDFWINRSKAPFNNYQRRVHLKKMSKWRNITFPIELLKEEYREIDFYVERRNRNLALFIAKEKAIKKILRQLKSGSVIQEAYWQEIKAKDDNNIKVKVIAKVEENIANPVR